MTFKRNSVRLAATFVAAMSVAALLPVSTASAEAAASPVSAATAPPASTGTYGLTEHEIRVLEAQEDCTVGNINDGKIWYVSARTDGGGDSRWYEDGDRLRVYDVNSDGHRTAARLSYCMGGRWYFKGYYDSGPNEGSIDEEEYNFDFLEGRRLRIWSCRKINANTVDRCGPFKGANA